MRSLRKSAVPPGLEASAQQATERYVASGGRTRPWATAEIRDAVTSETGGKCAYCEARMLNVDYGDIEHFRPRKVFPELVVSWGNLTLACGRCNGEKGSKWDEDVPFVNPFEDSISDHLFFLGPFVFGKSDRGDYTVIELDLNNSNRVEARNRALAEVENLLRLIAASGSYAKERLEAVIDKLCDSGEYSSAVRMYISARRG